MLKISVAETDEQIKAVADTAEIIWHEHFTPIIGEAQVNYMVEKFQSYPALCRAIREDGYRYYYGEDENGVCCYCGIHAEEEGRIFLSKLYVEKSRRKKGYSRMLLNRVKEDFPAYSEIYLTVNKHNDNTIDVYRHMGFVQTDDIVTDIGGGFVMDDYIFTLYLNK